MIILNQTGFFNYYRNKFNEFDKKGVHCSLSLRPECKIDSLKKEDVREYKQIVDDLRWEMANSKCFFKEANSKVECLSKDIRGAEYGIQNVEKIQIALSLALMEI